MSKPYSDALKTIVAKYAANIDANPKFGVSMHKDNTCEMWFEHKQSVNWYLPPAQLLALVKPDVEALGVVIETITVRHTPTFVLINLKGYHPTLSIVSVAAKRELTIDDVLAFSATLDPEQRKALNTAIRNQPTNTEVK